MIVGWIKWASATVSKMVAMVLPTGSLGSYSMLIFAARSCGMRATTDSFVAKTEGAGLGPADSGQKWRMASRMEKRCHLLRSISLPEYWVMVDTLTFWATQRMSSS